MKAGLSAQGKALTLSSMFEAVGAFKEGSISKEEFLDMEQNACPLWFLCRDVHRKFNELFNGSFRTCI